MSNKLIIGKFSFDLDKQTLIMGILNVTPDSFSDGGKFNQDKNAITHAKQMVQDGAHIIDVGGESTRPGYQIIKPEEEIERVVPIIHALKNDVDLPISIDTYKAKVAEQAILAGASMINDIWGAKADKDMASVAAQFDVPIVLMHNRESLDYNDLIFDMMKDLEESIEISLKAGVKEENIIIDPGVGFAKTPEDNLTVMRELHQFKELGYPILLGTSRKSFINHVLDLPVHDRVEGTGASVCLGIERGAKIVRVHDVKEMARMAKMMDAMLDKERV